MEILIWVIFWVVLFFAVIAPVIIIPALIYFITLVRTSKKKWGRKCSYPKDKEICEMHDIGVAWAEKYKEFKSEVDIYSGKYHLFGEYFDFGFDKAVIIISGRTESLLYSYYFAEPYRVSGYNVLVIDNRAHGKSDGVFNSLGYKEHRDVIEWCRFLHDKHGNKQIFLHGICIGASNALFAAAADDSPEYIQGLVTEGMFLNFYEMMNNRIKNFHQPVYPALWEIRGYIKLFTGYDIKKDGPVFRIEKLKKPILMMQSKEDIFSLPEKAKILYDKCSAPKKLVYFEKGRHSHIKINAPEKYDKVIVDFLAEICNNMTVTDEIIGE